MRPHEYIYDAAWKSLNDRVAMAEDVVAQAEHDAAEHAGNVQYTCSAQMAHERLADLQVQLREREDLISRPE